MSEKKKKVALIGWNPKVVDYRKWPGLTAEKVTAGLKADRDRLNSLGYEASLLLINDEASAFDAARTALQAQAYDGVMIGAGVRLDPEYLILFERLINAVHEAAPQAKICFNTNPQDTAKAVQRWV
ncbi:hypothetical protein [Endozoicomonas sp.]|uniref:hypothetical protein n=1 Tax=Endozoicomonas sp. TaxID=1892382 RepID=UPI00383B3B01